MGALAIQEAALPSKDKEAYIQSGLPWVHTLARKYSPNRDCLEDLISEGTIALLESYERFDPHRGVLFSTFAYQSIRGRMFDYLREQSGNIRPPDKAFRVGHRILKGELQHLSEAEIAEVLEISVVQARFGLQAMRTFRQKSMDQLLSEGTFTFHDIHGVEDDFSLFWLREFINTLQDEEKQIFIDLMNHGQKVMARKHGLHLMVAHEKVREIKFKFKSFLGIEESEGSFMNTTTASSPVKTRRINTEEAKQHGVRTVLDSVEWFTDTASPITPTIGITSTGLNLNPAAAKLLDVVLKQFIQVGYNAELKRLVIRKADTGIKLSKGYGEMNGAAAANSKRLSDWLKGKLIERKRYALEYDDTAAVHYIQVEVAEEE
ncbi:sigma-70 family RNA polymerase sigma factor [Paenibacillus sp. FSL L8-0436]|uniref:sigma-70 family RNA polymerase sigma factor n=1 Tax=Paenibacillus sp. FSL L8-0436 TaxID=2954686 RepID=UPI0031585522